MKNLLIVLISILFFACPRPDRDDPPAEAEGLKPIYSTGNSWTEITPNEARPIENLGKIYYKDETIYVIEKNQGIHIIDNSDPTNPTRVKFIEIQGCRDVAIKGNMLYADNVSDLVVLDISNLENINLVKRIENLYANSQLSYPESYEGYFECVDPDAGKIIGWETATLKKPECWR